MKVSKTGYKKNSKDKNEESLLIPSNRITMKDVEFPVLGISDTGDVRIMSPGEEHIFNGNYVYEIPVKKEGGHIVPGRYRNPEGNWLNKYQTNNTSGQVNFPIADRSQINNVHIREAGTGVKDKWADASRIINSYDNGMPNDTSYVYMTPSESFFYSTKVDPQTNKNIMSYQTGPGEFSTPSPALINQKKQRVMDMIGIKKDGGPTKWLNKYPRGGEYVSTNPEMLDLKQLGNTKYKIGLDPDKNFYVDLGNGTQFKFNEDLSNKIVSGFSDLMPGYDPYLASLNKDLSSGLPNFAKSTLAKPIINSVVHSQEKKLLAEIDAEEQKQKAELEQKLLEERKKKGIEGREFVKKLLNLDLHSINKSVEDRKASKYSVSDEYQLTPYKDSKTANEIYEKTPDYKIRYAKDTSYSEDDIKNIQNHLVAKGYLEPHEQINPSDYKTKDQIIALQKKLFKAGLGDVMGKEGPYQDGVTGIISNNTLKAINKYNESQKSFNIGELDDKTKTALKKYRNITDAQNVLDIEIADPNSLIDPETGLADVEKSTLELNLFEDALIKKGYFQGRTDYDFTNDPISPTKPKYRFTLNSDPKNETKFGYCMEYVNSEICRDDAFGDEAREELGLAGDAWHVSENIIDKGGSLVFGGLPDRSSVNLNSKNDITQYLKSTLTSPETLNGLKDLVGSGNIYDTNPGTKPKLQPGDVVNIFYEGSDFTEQAYKQTKNLNNRFFTTHVGVVKVADNGDLYIEHNIHHSIHKDKPQDFINGKIKGNGSKKVSLIAGITRPNYATAPSNIQSLGTQGLSYYDNNIAGLNPKGFGANPVGWNKSGNNLYLYTDKDNISSGIGNENTAKYINIMEKNKDKLLQDIPITENEYVKLARIARAIPVAETGAKDDYNTRYTRTKDGATYPLWMAKLLNYEDETSMGFTRLKDETNLNAGIREKLYGDDDSQLDEPTKAALPTFYLLSKNYLYLKEVANKYKVKATTDELVKLAGLGYNQSIGRIAKELVDKGSYDNYINYRKETAASGDGQYRYSNVLNAYDLQTKKYGGPTKWLNKYQDAGEVAADATAVKVNPLVRVINIDEPLPNINKPLSNFDYQNYYDKANKYLSRDIFKGTTLTAKDIADAANEFYTESNYQYPLDLLLTQAQIESKLGKQLKSKHNYFNVGNTDSGATRDFASAKDSVRDYINLMYNDYLNKGQKSVDELLKPKGFVNHQGNRYASNPDYEKMLSSQMQFINNYLKGYKNGGWLDKYQGETEGSQYERRDPNQLMYPTPGEEDTYTSQYSLPTVEITPNWTEAELERNKLRDKYIADDKKVWRHWYDKLGYDKNNVTKRANQYAYNKLAKQYLKGDKDKLTDEQKKFIGKSEYANRLQPSIGSRFVEGVTNPGFNLETLGNLAAPFEYPTNLVRGAVKGEFTDALMGQTPSPYFVSSDLAGTSPTEAAIMSGLVDAGVDTGIGAFDVATPLFKGARSARKAPKNLTTQVPSKGPGPLMLFGDLADKGADTSKGLNLEDFLTQDQINKGYSIVRDGDSSRYLLKKNNRYAGEIELFSPVADTKGDKWSSINIEIDPSHRGKGLSTPLYKVALNEARNKGYSGIKSIDEMLQSPEQSKAIRKYFPGRYSTDENLVRKTNEIIDESNKGSLEIGDTDLYPNASQVYLIDAPKGLSEYSAGKNYPQTSWDFKPSDNQYEYYSDFLDKRRNIIDNLKTPEGRKRLQALLDENPHLTSEGKYATVDDLIRQFEQTEFTATQPYFRSKNEHNRGAWMEDQLKQAIERGDVHPDIISKIKAVEKAKSRMLSPNELETTLDDLPKYVEDFAGLVLDKEGKPMMFDVDPKSGFNWYWSGYEHPSAMSIGRGHSPYDVAHILEHEWQHVFQKGKLLTGIDDELKKLDLLPDSNLGQKYETAVGPKRNIIQKLLGQNAGPGKPDLGYSGAANIGLKDRMEAKDYWLQGGKGQETAAMAAEIRENLLQRGIIKNRYDQITPKMLKDHYNLYRNTDVYNRYPIRVYDIMKDKNKNFRILSSVLNKMPATVPAIGAGYLGYKGMQEKKYGGWLNKYQDGSQVEPSSKEIALAVENLSRIWNLKDPSFTRPSNYGEYTPKFGWSRVNMTPEEKAYEKEYQDWMYSQIPQSWKDRYDWTPNVEEEYQMFKNDPNAPNNLRFTDDLNDYNVRGMWDSLERPSSWEQALTLYKDLNGEEWVPEEDGYYHGWSQHPGTGEWLKPKHHSTGWMNYIGYAFDPNTTAVVNPEGFFGNETLQAYPRKKKGGVTSQGMGYFDYINGYRGVSS